MNRKIGWIVKRSWGVLLAFFILCGVVAAIVSIRHNSEETFKTRPYNFDQEDVKHFLRARGINVEVVRVISRDAFGTKLFVFPFRDQIEQDRMITIGSNSLSVVTLPGTRSYPNSDGEFVAWFGAEATKTVHFKNGESLTLGAFDLFDVEPSGEYFIVGEKPNSTWLGRIASPSHKVRISSNLLGMSVLVSGKNIYVCGNFYTERTREAAYLIVQDDGKSFQVQGQRTFEWASGIVDVDPFSQRLLLWDKWDGFNSVYVYDLATNRRRRLGFAKRFQFFLANDLLRAEPKAFGGKGVRPLFITLTESMFDPNKGVSP